MPGALPCLWRPARLRSRGVWDGPLDGALRLLFAFSPPERSSASGDYEIDPYLRAHDAALTTQMTDLLNMDRSPRYSRLAAPLRVPPTLDRCFCRGLVRVRPGCGRAAVTAGFIRRDHLPIHELQPAPSFGADDGPGGGCWKAPGRPAAAFAATDCGE